MTAKHVEAALKAALGRKVWFKCRRPDAGLDEFAHYGHAELWRRELNGEVSWCFSARKAKVKKVWPPFVTLRIGSPVFGDTLVLPIGMIEHVEDDV